MTFLSPFPGFRNLVRTFVSVMTLSLLSMSTTDKSFKEAQKKYERVNAAFTAKSSLIQSMLKGKGVSIDSLELYLRAFKKEKLLQVFAKNRNEKTFRPLTEYEFCYLSGTLGPKRKQGDLQVPEGFYFINVFNPLSNYHLSMGINYPNKSDRILGNKKPGGEIFIHGDCVSIGCIPITDDKIMELYVLCVEAKSAGQEKIPVHIFPAIMDEKGMENLSGNYDPALFSFWQNIKPGYDFFEKTKSLPEISVDSKGKYTFR